MNKEKMLKELVVDFRRFSTVLVALSVLIYIGISIKGFSISNTQIGYLIGFIFVLMGLAFLFLICANKCQKKLMDLEDMK